MKDNERTAGDNQKHERPVTISRAWLRAQMSAALDEIEHIIESCPQPGLVDLHQIDIAPQAVLDWAHTAEGCFDEFYCFTVDACDAAGIKEGHRFTKDGLRLTVEFVDSTFLFSRGVYVLACSKQDS